MVRKTQATWTREVEYEYIRRTQAGDKQAEEVLVDQFQNMIYRLAARVSGDKDPSDMYQQACIEFLDLIRYRFDLSRGCRLTTYAYSTIPPRLHRHATRNTLIHIPLHAWNSETGKRGRSVMSLDKVVLDSPEHRTVTMGAEIPDYRANEYESQLDHHQELQQLHLAIERLPPRYRFVLRLRLAGWIQRDIGILCDCTKSNVQQIERAAQQRIRDTLEGNTRMRRRKTA